MYLSRYLEKNIRCDGRSFQQQRVISFHNDSTHSILKMGNTSVLCSVSLEKEEKTDMKIVRQSDTGSAKKTFRSY